MKYTSQGKEKTMEETKQETTKKQKRLTWESDLVKGTATVTMHLIGKEKFEASLTSIYPAFKDASEGLQQLVLCGLREKVSQMHNQAISSYQKKNAKELKEGTKAKLPPDSEIFAAVKGAIEALQQGKWPSDIRTPAEEKVKLSDVKKAMFDRMIEQGIDEQTALAIIAKL